MRVKLPIRVFFSFNEDISNVISLVECKEGRIKLYVLFPLTSEGRGISDRIFFFHCPMNF